ncbi:MAG: nucleotide sugar dehydrogenase [Nitrososphaeraceae archaeon]
MQLQKTLDAIQSNSLSIEIFGLGYVGFPLAVRLASAGLKVTGIDINSQRIHRLQNNVLMDSELHLKNEFLQAVKNRNLQLASSPSKSDNPKIGIICVPTPIPDGHVRSSVFVKDAIENFLGTSKEGDLIIIESSIEIGTTEEMQKIIESKGFKVGYNYGLCFCPERIDPQNKKWTLENIPRVIYCSDDISFKIMQKIYSHVNNANILRVNLPKIAEVVKSFENAYRLVNISLVNELAILCDKLGINVKEVIDAASTKPFGFTPFYPGAGAGGHCIPKDPRFLLESAKKIDAKFTTIENAININAQMPFYICNSIEETIRKLNLTKSVLVCGLTYKADVEDMRDSPSFKIISELKTKGFKVFTYDPFFKMDLVDKYLIENNMKELNFEQKNNLSDESLRGVSCLCIVQHHTQIKPRLEEIYEKSLVSFIYDCQGKLKENQKSKTVLDSLGN